MRSPILLSLMCFLLYSCGGEPRESQTEESFKTIDDEETVAESIEDVVGSINFRNDTVVKAEDYLVILTVDSLIKMNENGILKVWIGQDSLEHKLENGMIKDETTIPSNLGSYATITPFAPDF